MYDTKFLLCFHFFCLFLCLSFLLSRNFSPRSNFIVLEKVFYCVYSLLRWFKAKITIKHRWKSLIKWENGVISSFPLEHWVFGILFVDLHFEMQLIWSLVEFERILWSGQINGFTILWRITQLYAETIEMAH